MTEAADGHEKYKFREVPSIASWSIVPIRVVHLLSELQTRVTEKGHTEDSRQRREERNAPSCQPPPHLLSRSVR